MEKACKLEPKNNKYLVFKNKILLSLAPGKLVDLPENDLYVAQYNLAIQSYNTGNFDSALVAINKALDITPNDNKALLIKSQIFLDQKKYEDAITILLLLTEENQGNYEAHFYLGEAFYITKDYDNSFQHFMLSFPNVSSKREAVRNCTSILKIMELQNSKNYAIYSEQLAPYISQN